MSNHTTVAEIHSVTRTQAHTASGPDPRGTRSRRKLARSGPGPLGCGCRATSISSITLSDEEGPRVNACRTADLAQEAAVVRSQLRLADPVDLRAHSPLITGWESMCRPRPSYGTIASTSTSTSTSAPYGIVTLPSSTVPVTPPNEAAASESSRAGIPPRPLSAPVRASGGLGRSAVVDGALVSAGRGASRSRRLSSRARG